MPKIFYDEVVFNFPFRMLNLFHEHKDTLKNIATPSVRNVRVWSCSGAVVTITNFLDGTDNHPISILGDGNTTVSNNATIKTNTGANKLLGANKVYRFTLINNIWYEDA